LLNGEALALDTGFLVIADASKAVALAGIMGGLDTSVTEATRDVFLESAYFSPEVIAGKTRVLNFASDSSYRFERGVDFSATLSGLERATQLTIEICGGAAGPVTEARATLPARDPVRLRLGRVERLLGVKLDGVQVGDILRRLRFEFSVADGEFRVTPPSDRKVLLLGLRDFPCSSYARHLSASECQAAKLRYEQAVLQALEILADQHPDLVIRPLPMCTNHFGGDDRWFYRRLIRGNAKLTDRLDYSLLGAELTPIEYCEAFRSSHVALTMRFHSMVFALGMGVPAVGIDYTLGKGKVCELAERFGVPYQSLAELDAGFIVREVNGLFVEPRLQAEGFMPEFIQVVQNSLPKLLQPSH
jgi:hypothetical protein